MAEVREFKTESKRLLDLMINSIYTNREIFLRELISNASDAIDRYHYLSLSDERLPKTLDYEIFIAIDKKKRTLSITDNGIGMTYDELIESLGTIAKSGSLDFMQKLKNKTDKETIEIIGQFGVGFYSAFMVAKKVEVRTKSPFSEEGYIFASAGAETYEIEKAEALPTGTTVTLYLRKNSKEENYDEFLEEYNIRRLVKKYSDYIRHPIRMKVKKSVPKLDDDGKPTDKYEEIEEIETLNSMTPIWKRRKSDVTDEELNDFYKQKYFDASDPIATIFINVEGAVNYTALVYIPKKPPYDLYSEHYEKGLQLYSKGVFIMEKCKELVPDYLRFIKGLVDSSDFSLNISREILQQSRELEKIAENVEKKIVGRLKDMLKNDRGKYKEFWEAYGVNIKFGVYDRFGLKKDLLKDLLIFRSVNQDDYITLKEYVDAMSKEQEYIYYASGKTKEQVLSMPQMDIVKKQGYDVLILTDDIDEFAMQMLFEYEKKKVKSVNQGELDLLSKEDEKKLEELAEDKKSLLEKMKEILKDKVTNVVFSKRLTESPVCLVSEDGISLEMEKVIANLPSQDKPKASKVLEINPKHPLFTALENLYNDNDPMFEEFAELLYSQALLIEGFPLKNPAEFSRKVSELMIKAAKY